MSEPVCELKRSRHLAVLAGLVHRASTPETPRLVYDGSLRFAPIPAVDPLPALTERLLSAIDLVFSPDKPPDALDHVLHKEAISATHN